MIGYDFITRALNAKQLESDSSSDSLRSISAEGLTVDNKTLPCFNLFELFEELTKSSKISKEQIEAKINAFACYLSNKSEAQEHIGLRTSAIVKFLSEHKDVESVNSLFNNTLLTLFAYSFKFRIEVYRTYRGVVSIQYFGLKHSYIRRVLLTSDSYVLLKKKHKPTLRLTNAPNGKLNTLRPTLDFKSSTMTLATTYSQTDSPHASNVNLFSALRDIPTCQSLKVPGPEAINNVFNTSVCSVEELDTCTQPPILSHDKSKTTGRLKFYNEAKEYGFIVMNDKTEVFVHKADLLRHNIDTRSLAYYRQYYDIVMEFNVQEYKGREKVNRKAVDLAIRDMIAVC